MLDQHRPMSNSKALTTKLDQTTTALAATVRAKSALARLQGATVKA